MYDVCYLNFILKFAEVMFDKRHVQYAPDARLKKQLIDTAVQRLSEED